ncbi:MAG: hypothetical protein AB8G18_03700 [Gammaproteobacteria bacterium]
MDNKSWLISEAKRLSDDIKEVKTDIAVIERKFEVQVVDWDNTLPLGLNEWGVFKARIMSSLSVMNEQLSDFINNRYGRQLHWSALRLLAASGVLSAEIDSYQSKLAYIAKNPSEKSEGVALLCDYFTARLQPVGGRFSLRVTQLLTRVMDPYTWSVEANVSQSQSDPGNVRLRMEFRPETKNRRREEREHEKRMKRIEIN